MRVYFNCEVYKTKYIEELHWSIYCLEFCISYYIMSNHFFKNRLLDINGWFMDSVRTLFCKKMISLFGYITCNIFLWIYLERKYSDWSFLVPYAINSLVVNPIPFTSVFPFSLRFICFPCHTWKCPNITVLLLVAIGSYRIHKSDITFCLLVLIMW